MVDFVLNRAHRHDPYKNFKFRVLWPDKRDGTHVPIMGVSKVSMLKRTTEVVTHRNGGDDSRDHKYPGRTSYEGITMERGITHDTEFEKWANLVHPYAGDTEKSLVDFRKNLMLEVMNEKGHVALRYFLYECWVSEFTAVPDLDANANAVAIESIKIEMEGWEREVATPEPDESKPVPKQD
ncbi:MAG: phage tail protein [Methanosarcinales archaeon]|nr:phage tail protein [Methanosarcinales archaeon]